MLGEALQVAHDEWREEIHDALGPFFSHARISFGSLCRTMANVPIIAIPEGLELKGSWVL